MGIWLNRATYPLDPYGQDPEAGVVENGEPGRAGSLRRVRRVSVVDEIVEQLTRRIIAGEWAPGAVIPSLRAFSAEFGVSTLTIREALRTLQERGMVETRHGAGTFVRAPEQGESTVAWMLSPTEADEYLELIEARRIIEGELVRLAATRRTEGQLEDLSGIMASMEAARHDAAAFLEADLAFHIALAEAANNRILLRTMLAIRGPIKRLIANRTLRHLEEQGDLEEAIADHRDILEALTNQSTQKGREALERIVQRGERDMRSLKDEDLTVGPDLGNI